MKPRRTSGRSKEPTSGKQALALVRKSLPSSFVGLMIPAVIFMLTVLTYLPVLQNGFVNWDDESFLVNNFNYRGLGWQQIRWMFTTCYLSSCMPLTWVTYGLDYVLWGMNPRGYHLTSLLIHAANALLFYFVSLRLLRLSVSSPTVSSQLPIQLAAGFAALFFALHPLQVEVVAWTIGREMAVAGFFLFFLTLLCYLKAAQNESQGGAHWRWMGAAWVFYAMSLLAKEVAMTLPFALVALDVYPLRRLGSKRGRWFGLDVRRVWWEKVPFLLLALSAGVRAVLGERGNRSRLSSCGLWLPAESGARALQFSILPLEDPPAARIVSALPVASFHRNLAAAMAFERRFCVCAHRSLLLCQATLARRSGSLGFLCGALGAGERHRHFRASARC
jgi:hypothetical protein